VLLAYSEARTAPPTFTFGFLLASIAWTLQQHRSPGPILRLVPPPAQTALASGWCRGGKGDGRDASWSPLSVPPSFPVPSSLHPSAFGGSGSADVAGETENKSKMSEGIDLVGAATSPIGPSATSRAPAEGLARFISPSVRTARWPALHTHGMQQGNGLVERASRGQVGVRFSFLRRARIALRT
jgi:hypothetical protein